jgi:hypothetical protein
VKCWMWKDGSAAGMRVGTKVLYPHEERPRSKEQTVMRVAKRRGNHRDGLLTYGSRDDLEEASRYLIGSPLRHHLRASCTDSVDEETRPTRRGLIGRPSDLWKLR